VSVSVPAAPTAPARPPGWLLDRPRSPLLAPRGTSPGPSCRPECGVTIEVRDPGEVDQVLHSGLKDLPNVIDVPVGGGVLESREQVEGWELGTAIAGVS
jgi:hypothetical protein